MTVSLQNIRDAYENIKEGIVRTPTTFSPALSDHAGTQIYCKHEQLQRTGSFKDRGSLNKLLSLSDAEKENGVITMSAGNHAQSVAYHAKRLNIPSTILMPEGTPSTKINRTALHGAEIILKGSNLSELEPVAQDMIAERELTLVHPFDDEIIVNGQGTIGIEMLEDIPELDCIVVPIGGGGIISGIASAAKAIKPEIKVIGVEAKSYATASKALGYANLSVGGDTLADGIAVKRVGEVTLPIINKFVDDILLVNEEQIEQSVSNMFEHGRIIAEGAAATTYAAVYSNPHIFKGKNVGIVICGANIDERMLSSIFIRSLRKKRIISHLNVHIRDIPGQLSTISAIVAKYDGNILEVEHKRMLYAYHVKHAVLRLIVETRGPSYIEEIIKDLNQHQYSVDVVNA